MALASLKGVDLLVLASTKAPVAFFAYPGAPSVLVPESCALETLATPEEDATFALQALADELSAPVRPVVAERAAHAVAPTGKSDRRFRSGYPSPGTCRNMRSSPTTR